MRDILVGLLTCGLVASAVAYGELQWATQEYSRRGWRGLKRLALYAVAGVMVAELGAGPLMWALIGLRSGLPETLAMSLALGVAMSTINGLLAERLVNRDITD